MNGSGHCPTAENTDHVHRYVAGTLTLDEVTAFEHHLLGCTECQQAVRDGAAIRAALLPAPAAEKKGVGTRRILVAAAPLAAAAGLAVWFLLPGSGDVRGLGQLDSAPDLTPLPVRADADSAASLADRGIEAYRRGEFREAAALLTRAAHSGGTAGLRFFLGISHLMSGSPQQAAMNLEAALEPVGNPYAAEAQFYLGKTWLQMGQADSALVHLAAVPPSAPIRARAEALADSVRQALR